MPRTTRLFACALLLATTLTMAVGCSSDGSAETTTTEMTPAHTAVTPTTIEAEPTPIRIGALSAEDILPFWVAEAEGIFAEAGLEVEIITFQSAEERDEAFVSGGIDAFAGDIAAAIELEAGGTPVSMVAVLHAGDATGEGQTEAVLVVSDKFIALPDGMVTARDLLAAWDEAVDVIDSDPDVWRDLLEEKAQLAEQLVEDEALNVYPKAQAPTREQVDAVLEWMLDNELLTSDISYEDLVQELPE